MQYRFFLIVWFSIVVVKDILTNTAKKYNFYLTNESSSDIHNLFVCKTIYILIFLYLEINDKYYEKCLNCFYSQVRIFLNKVILNHDYTFKLI